MARSPVLPRFAGDLGAETWLIGVIVGASTITGVLVKLPAGALSDILGRRQMLLIGAAFFAFPPFLYLLVTSPGALLGLRFLHGLATAIFSPVAAAAVADLFQAGRGEKLGWFASANEMGSAFGPLLGGALLANAAGATLAKYHMTYLVVGTLGMLPLLLLLVLPVARTGHEQMPRAPGQPTRAAVFKQGIMEVITSRPIVIASSVEAAMFLGVGALMGFLPLYGKEVLSLGDGQLGLLIWAPLVMAMAGKPLTGRLSDRIGRKPVILGGLLLCAAMLPAVALTRSLWGLLAEGAVFGLGMAIVTPATMAFVTDLCKSQRYGAALGVFGTIWDVGEASGPIVAGILIAVLGGAGASYLVAFSIIAVVLVAAGMVFGLTVEEVRVAPVG